MNSLLRASVKMLRPTYPPNQAAAKPNVRLVHCKSLEGAQWWRDDIIYVHEIIYIHVYII